jgi:Trp operon repressor
LSIFNLNLLRKINSIIDKKYKNKLLKKKKEIINKKIIDKLLVLILVMYSNKKFITKLSIFRLLNKELKNNGIAEILNPSKSTLSNDSNTIEKINNKSFNFKIL